MLDGLPRDWASVYLYWSLKCTANKFLNVSYILSSFPSEPISLVFYWKYWWENQNKCSFDRKHIAGKAWGYFSNPGLPPLSLSVSVLVSGSWQLYSSCKVPLFHLMLKYEPRTMREYNTSCKLRRKLTFLLGEIEVWAPYFHFWFQLWRKNYKNIIEFMNLL